MRWTSSQPSSPAIAAVSVRGVVKSVGSGRGARRILDGVDLEVRGGEVVAILGRSGSGKSTLLHLIGGLDRPDAGEIEVAGERVTGIAERRLSALRRDHVGFVFQFFHLLPELSGAANVRLAASLPGARDGGPARADELIERLGLATVAESLPRHLSGGEQQRFAIARALVNDPSVLLADEPTGNLDSTAARTVLDLLRAGADEGRAVVVVTHEAATTAAADRVVRLEEGRLVG